MIIVPTAYWEYRMAIISISTLICIGLSLYFFINRSKKQEFRYYWKGFFSLFIASILTLSKFIIPMSVTFNLIRIISTLVFVIYGFYLVIIRYKARKPTI